MVKKSTRLVKIDSIYVFAFTQIYKHLFMFLPNFLSLFLRCSFRRKACTAKHQHYCRN